jgi:predicted nucleotidyltransferase
MKHLCYYWSGGLTTKALEGGVVMLHKELASVFAKYNVLVAYLFGSQVEGGADAMSDVDIGVVSDGRGLSLDDVLLLQADLGRLFRPARVDLILLENVSCTLAYQAIAKGKVVYSVSEELRTDFEEHVLRLYHDFAPFMDAFYRDVRELLIGGDGLD